MTDPTQTWVLDLGWAKPPLSMNDRRHHHAEAQIVTEINARTRSKVADAGIRRLAHATVRLVWTVPDQRIRDVENPVATLKACCDALKDEVRKGVRLPGIVPDDSPRWMTKHMPEIRYRRGQRAVHLVITGRPV